MSRLLVTKGKMSGLLLEIDKPLIVLGRDPSCDYFFEDNKISRRHCTIHRNDDDEYFIIDNGSRNHVYVNDVQLSESSLHDGDRIVIGDTELVFELDSSEKKQKAKTRQMVENSSWGVKQTIINVKDDSYIKLPAKVTVKHLKEAYKRMLRLSKITSLLQSSTNWLELFSRVADILLKEFKPDTVSVFRVLANEEFAAFIQKEQKDQRSAPKKVSKKILQDCYRRKIGFIITDATKDTQYSLEDTIINAGVRSAMCVPVLLDNKIEAIIYLDSITAGNKFNRVDLQLLTGIASQLTTHMRSILLIQSNISERVLQSELDVARKIQTMFLKMSPPEIPGISISTYYDPAKAVGGDYFDFVRLSEDKLAIVIADVSGKGLPSAMMMASFRAHFLTEMNHTSEPVKVMKNMNKYVWEDVKGRIYVTSVLLIYDIPTGEFEYVNAGHPYPLIFRKDGGVEEYSTGGFYLGLKDENVYEKGNSRLDSGDTLVLYTDGFIDQISEDQGIFGRQRLISSIKKYLTKEPEELVHNLVHDIHNYLGDEDIFDDMSIIVFRRNNNHVEE